MTLPQNAVILIVGGASGIGLACGKKFASKAFTTILADLNLAQAEKEAHQLGVHVIGLSVDVTDSQSVETLMKTAIQRFGRLDVLVNSAGIGGGAALPHEKTVEDFDKRIAINLRGTFLTLKYAIPYMLDGGGGAIVNIASIGGMQGMPYSCDYSASKAGVIALTRSAAKAYASVNIRVNAICPGWVETPMVEEVIAREGTDFQNLMVAQVPLGRISTPEEISDAVWFAAAESSYMTGSALVIDGGILA